METLKELETKLKEVREEQAKEEAYLDETFRMLNQLEESMARQFVRGMIADRGLAVITMNILKKIGRKRKKKKKKSEKKEITHKDSVPLYIRNIIPLSKNWKIKSVILNTECQRGRIMLTVTFSSTRKRLQN